MMNRLLALLVLTSFLSGCQSLVPFSSRALSEDEPHGPSQSRARTPVHDDPLWERIRTSLAIAPLEGAETEPKRWPIHQFRSTGTPGRNACVRSKDSRAGGDRAGAGSFQRTPAPHSHPISRTCRDRWGHRPSSHSHLRPGK